MTTRYMDTAGSNTSPYDTWAKAATSLQTILDLAVAGDICYCRGIQTLAATLDVDTQTGDVISGFIKFIGCAAGGGVDGTRMVVDGNSAAANCLLGVGTSNYYWFENFEFKNATGDGLDFDGNIGWVFINSISHNNGAAGWDIYAEHTFTFIRCVAYSNSNDGWKDCGGICHRFLFCSAYANANNGFDGTTGTRYAVFIGCVATDNGDNDTGFANLDESCLLFNCVADGTNQTGEVGIDLGDHYCIVLGCRITNVAEGLDGAGKLGIYGWNYFHNNTADLAGATLLANIPHDEQLTNHYNAIDGSNKADVDADDGFNDPANKDFNLKETRTLRKTEIGLGIGS